MMWLDWKDHYIEHVAVATNEWLKSHPDKQGTCAGFQMEDIRNEALAEIGRRQSYTAREDKKRP